MPPHVDVHLGVRARPDQHRPLLTLALHERGAGVSFTFGRDAYDLGAGRVAAWWPRVTGGRGRYALELEPRALPLDRVTVIRNEGGPLPVAVPQLSHPPARRLTDDKVASNRLLDTLALGKAWAPLDTDHDVEAALAVVTSRDVVVKPVRGRRSRGLWMGTRDQLAAIWAARRIDLSEPWVVEERLDTTLPLPLTAASFTDGQLLRAANHDRLVKELRTWVFGRDGAGAPIVRAAVRFGLPGAAWLHDDEWIFLDPAALPAEPLAHLPAIVTAIEAATGTSEVLLAVDWTLAPRDGDDAPRWLPMELNGNPELIWEEDSPDLAAEQAGLLADQLLRVAARQTGPRSATA